MGDTATNGNHAPGLSTAIRATRPQFLTASVLPVLIGTAWGWRMAGGLDAAAFLLALLATSLMHAASNVYNDVSDEVFGTDRANAARIAPYTGGSRVIQDGVLSLEQMRRLSVTLAALATGAGTILALRAGPGVIAFGIAGGTLGAAYSLPGVRLSGRGLGEMTIAAAFGLLPVTGAAWLQTGSLDAGATLLSLPVSAWVAAIIIANEIPDADADGRTGKRTLAVRLGARTPLAYAAIQAAGFIAAAACITRGLLPAWMLVLFVALFAAAIFAANALGGSRADVHRGIQTTLAIHATGALGLLMALLAGR